jgi:hypothetical protein
MDDYVCITSRLDEVSFLREMFSWKRLGPDFDKG